MRQPGRLLTRQTKTINAMKVTKMKICNVIESMTRGWKMGHFRQLCPQPCRRPHKQSSHQREYLPKQSDWCLGWFTGFASVVYRSGWRVADRDRRVACATRRVWGGRWAGGWRGRGNPG